MPALAALTINDGQATPVAHTFSPVRIDSKGVATFYDRSSGIAIGFPRITVSMKEPIALKKAGDSSKNRGYRSVITIDRPTLASTSAATGTGIPPAPTISHVHSIRMDLDLPEMGVLAERNDIHAYAVNTLSNATIKGMIQNLESFY